MMICPDSFTIALENKTKTNKQKTKQKSVLAPYVCHSW